MVSFAVEFYSEEDSIVLFLQRLSPIWFSGLKVKEFAKRWAGRKLNPPYSRDGPAKPRFLFFGHIARAVSVIMSFL